MILLSCNSSGDEHIETPTVEPYKIVIAFYDSSYKSSAYSQGFYRKFHSYLCMLPIGKLEYRHSNHSQS